ncbi:tRNA methyl transferase-domain-containing protein [Jimgerdemannia flammicorona]|uniref:tRNA methyl transferase-domain-containing protein n=1 Tax=Jimgerdemannia flammicorona TaxID=994334 RepID=A0A433D506_9FUNG|nr:tRNA methyl transferase-domain-containing protein [Jimgerdemannia flammicorona]
MLSSRLFASSRPLPNFTLKLALTIRSLTSHDTVAQHTTAVGEMPPRVPLPGDKVILGMSGGVDSSVSALLLQRQGFEVEGVYMRNWDTADERGVCTSEEDWRDVGEVCHQLNVPCRRIDFTKQYWTQVFSRTLDDYACGITPNPDVLCNREIKFGALLERCLGKDGADTDAAMKARGKMVWFATGHYARIERRADGTVGLLRDDNTRLQWVSRG